MPAKYLCFCYYDIEKFAALSPAQQEEVGRECHPYDAGLVATGKVVAVGSLSEPQTWKVARPRDRKPVISDGPYLDTTLQVGAFIIIEADNMDEAMQAASKHAAANYGEHLGFAVEVRACESFDLSKEL